MDVILGGKCTAKLLEEPLQAKEVRFREDCKAFLVDLCLQIRDRFDMNPNGVLGRLKIINPRDALGDGDTKRAASISALAAQSFPHLVPDLDELDDQWRELGLCDVTKGYADPAALLDSPEKFWDSVSKMKDGLGGHKFDIISQFMKYMMSLPHSSACVERIFSRQYDKNETRIGDMLLHWRRGSSHTSM